jgi:hypothetical protein
MSFQKLKKIRIVSIENVLSELSSKTLSGKRSTGEKAG